MPSFAMLLVIGLASTTFQILFSLSVHRLRLLLFSLGASVLFLMQYLLLGQWIGFYSGLVGTTYTMLLALGYRWPVLQHRALTFVAAAGYLGVFLLLVNWATFEPYEAIPLIAGVATLFALHARNLVITKIIFLTAGSLWLSYEFANTMYTQMFGEVFELLGNAASLLVLLRLRYPVQLWWLRRPTLRALDARLPGFDWGRHTIIAEPLLVTGAIDLRTVGEARAQVLLRSNRG